MHTANLFDLSGRVSVITGARSGLGRVFCETMAENGSHVVCAKINEGWAKETADMISENGIRAIAVKADVPTP